MERDAQDPLVVKARDEANKEGERGHDDDGANEGPPCQLLTEKKGQIRIYPYLSG